MKSVIPRPSTNASVVHRAFDILGAFAQGSGSSRELSLSDVARRAGMPKSTVHRLLGTLLDIGAVELEHGRYRVSLNMLSIVTSSPEAAVRAAAMPYLLALHRAVGHTIHLCVLRGENVVYLEKLHGPKSRLFPTNVGMTLPANCTAVGKSLLAFTDDTSYASSGSRRLSSLTERSIVDPAVLRADLARVRQRGIAIDANEAVLGRSCIARPIIVAGVPIAAVSVGFPSSNGPSTHLIPPLVKIVDSIARAVGAHSSNTPVHGLLA